MTLESKEMWTWHGSIKELCTPRHPHSCVTFLTTLQQNTLQIEKPNMESAWIEDATSWGFFDNKDNVYDGKHKSMLVYVGPLNDCDSDTEWDHVCKVKLIAIDVDKGTVTVCDQNNHEYTLSQQYVLAYD